MPDVSTHILATRAAVIETKMTRRYCMKATRRWSAPKAPAISTMAVAAPGDEPQTAVVPGRMRQRLISQPSRLEAASGRQHHAEEQRPFLVEDRKDVGRDRRRDKAADDRPGRRRTAGAARAPWRHWCRQGSPPASGRSAGPPAVRHIPARRRTAARRPAGPATAGPGACAPCVRRPAGLARNPYSLLDPCRKIAKPVGREILRPARRGFWDSATSGYRTRIA